MSGNSSVSLLEKGNPNLILYGIFQSGQLLSLPVYGFLLIHLLKSRILRRELSNHVIFVILLINFIQVTIDQSFLLNYLRTGLVSPSTWSACLFWLFVDAYTYDTGTLLMSWASMERHILIFHRNWLRSRRQRWLIHYLPILFLVSYTFCFFVYAMFFFPCENSFDYTSAYCGYACFYSSTIIVAYESLVHEAIPIILIGLFSIALLIRVVLRKQRLHRRLNWRKYRKMTIQLLMVSTLYFTTNFPYTINPILTLLFNVTPINENIQSILLNFVSVIMPLTLPFVCLGLIPNLREKFYWRNRRRRQIQPFITRPIIPTRETHF